MKKILFFVFLISCASKTHWDSGASKSQSYGQEQRQEQLDQTRNQFPNATSPEPF